METQLQQLKLNVTNIRSVLKNANKQNLSLRKSNAALISQTNKERKVKQKESKVEKKISPSTSPIAAAKNIASPSMGLFDKIKNFGALLLAGVFANALPGIFKKIDEFREENKEIIDNVVTALTVVKDFGEWVVDSMTDPEAKDDAFDKIATFDDTGKITGGALHEVQKQFDKFGQLVNKIDKALGGKGTLGNQFIDEDNIFGSGSRADAVRRARQRYQESGTLPPSGASSAPSKLGSTGKTLSTLTDQDFSDLAYAVSGEAKRDSDDEYGVAANVLTRVADPNYPNTIMGVFTAGSHSQPQYAAYWDGGARRDPQLANKLKANKNKIAEAMVILNGRTEFKGTSEYGNMGAGDIKFHPRGNFYHYANQVGKYDPPPKNPPEFWKKFVNTNPQIKPNNKREEQAEALNNTVGEDGSTTIIVATQPIVTGKKG